MTTGDEFVRELASKRAAELKSKKTRRLSKRLADEQTRREMAAEAGVTLDVFDRSIQVLQRMRAERKEERKRSREARKRSRES